MGLRPEKMMETDLTPRNLQTGATWKFPPVLLMAAGNDQPEILELINNTQAALQTKVSCLWLLLCQVLPRALLSRPLSSSMIKHEESPAVEGKAVQSLHEQLPLPKAHRRLPACRTWWWLRPTPSFDYAMSTLPGRAGRACAANDDGAVPDLARVLQPAYEGGQPGEVGGRL